jgi:3-oxoacyl-[acyl-carrier protein] reductase
VNNIQPGPINTDMNPDTGEFSDTLKQLLPIGRYGKTEEIASLVMWLISPEAGYMTGSSLNMDGGFTI